MNLLLVLLLALRAGPSGLTSDDLAQRLSAVQKWSKQQKKPQLSWRDARSITECIEVPPVKETGCELSAKLCPLHEGDDGSSGTRVESVSLLMTGEDDELRPLRVFWRAAYEAKLSDCEPPESFVSHQSTEQRGASVAAWKKVNAKEYSKCVARLERRAESDAEELTCDLLLVNGCRREAYVTCKARNLRQGVATLLQLHRFEF